MPGFLDRAAPSIGAEYGRYVGGDTLGKILFKNVLLNILKIPERDIMLPLGSQHHEGCSHDLAGDAGVWCNGCRGRPIDIEIKYTRLIVDRRELWPRGDAWLFSCCRLTSKGKEDKRAYDLLFGIGILEPVLGAGNDWDRLRRLAESYRRSGREPDLEAYPHQRNFLSRCGIFCIPFERVKNYTKVTLRCMENNSYYDYFAWGDDVERCKMIWARARREVLKNRM